MAKFEYEYKSRKFRVDWEMATRKTAADGYIELIADVYQIGFYRIKEHRYVWIKHNGPIPEGMLIHHKNNIKTDNRISNLQIVTPKEHRRIHSGWVLENSVWFKRCVKCDSLYAADDYKKCPVCKEIKPQKK